MNKFFVTVCYSGLAPKASGTVGTVASIPLGLLLLFYLPLETFWLLLVLILVAGSKSIDKYQIATNRLDPKEVVIDELLGIWIAMAMIPEEYRFEPFAILLAFVLFRYFDITKPSFIGKVDRHFKSGFGVMLDDLIAGVVAGVLSVLLIRGWEFVF